MWVPPCADVSTMEGGVLCAERPSAGMHAMAQDLSMVGIDRAKSVLYLGRGLDDPARWCARRPACVPCLEVSGSVEPQHTALARLERPPDVAARILMSSVLHPSPRATSGPS